MGICESPKEKELGIISKSMPVEFTNIESKKKELGMGNKPLSKEQAKSQNEIEEFFMENIPVPMKTANKLSKSICKITYINMDQKKINGTGFFMIYNSLKSLISVNHVITSNLINENIEIEINNKKNLI